MAETVTSIWEPCAEKGARLAVTMTAATFLVLIGAPRVLTPSRSSMVCSACCVNGAFLSESPVLFSPTTRP